MEYQIFADGEKITSREDAVDINGKQMGRAYDRLRDFIDRGSIEGVGTKIEVKPIDSHNWGEPYEAFGSKKGTVKHLVVDVRIRAKDWVKLQASAHGIESIQSAIKGATSSTVEDVRNAIDDNDAGTLSQIPMPVLEIYMDGTCSHAEGRSRGVGVLNSNQQYIPIRVASRVYR
jgi:hypothetical protein